MSRIYSLFIRLIRHELITGSFFIFIGGTIANFLAFILNLFFARNLSYSDYGILAALLSLFNLATIPAQSISAVIVRFASQFLFGNEEEKASSLFKKLFSLFTLLGAIAMVVMYVLSPSIGKFLRINDHFLVIVLVFTVVLNYLLTINLAFLNSLLRFKFISISGLLGGIVKLGIGVSLVPSFTSYPEERNPAASACATTPEPKIPIFSMSMYAPNGIRTREKASKGLYP